MVEPLGKPQQLLLERPLFLASQRQLSLVSQQRQLPERPLFQRQLLHQVRQRQPHRLVQQRLLADARGGSRRRVWYPTATTYVHNA
jgi:hypothetical protein